MVVKQYGIDKLAFYYANLLHNQCTSKMVVDNFQHVSLIVHDLNILVRQVHNQLLGSFFFDIRVPTNFLKEITILNSNLFKINR